MSIYQTEYKNNWIRILSIAIIERWLRDFSGSKITPDIIAGLELSMASKLKELPFLLGFSVRIFSCITRIYCSLRFRSVGFRSIEKRAEILDWLMNSDNKFIESYRLFIEKFTTLYLMEQLEKIESSGQI
tara:strand:+ start:85 stop:474 length:390 start_codon:yes stop_codon:yes gene_type:complete